jgi:decaprenylphospho-beta-D-ribofuranose 2-oxidase
MKKYLVLLLTLPLLLHAKLVTDNGRIYKAQIEQYFQPASIEALQQHIRQASKEGKTISFAGQKHTQGGHTFSENGIVIDMKLFNKIISIDREAKLLRVQAGATWEEIQDAINPYGLAVKVMQASNIFTVGGSLSANAHGRDPNYGTLIETIRSISVVKADGSIVTASRTQNTDLFRAVIGGYGLFGAILEAEIELTNNVVYLKHAEIVPTLDYPAYFQENVQGQKEVGLHFARMHISPSNNLTRVIAISFIENPEAVCDLVLHPESNIFQNQLKLQLLRHTDLAKTLRGPWEIRAELKEQIISRNQAMRPPVKCLSYGSKNYTDILQEYFIPLDRFADFTESLRQTIQEEKINILNVTIRYVPQDTSSLLPYAKTDSFAFVLYVTQGLSKEEKEKALQWTRRLINAALDCQGTYYLPYQLYATPEQMQKAYPEFTQVIQAKQTHDPQNIFSNIFYQTYFSPMIYKKASFPDNS